MSAAPAKYTFQERERYAAFRERLQRYLPAGLTLETLETPLFQKWWKEQLAKHKEELTLFQLGSLQPEQAQRLADLQAERLRYTAHMANKRFVAEGQSSQAGQAAQPKPAPEDPAAKAARLQVLR